MKKFLYTLSIILFGAISTLSAQNLITEDFEIRDSVISSGTPGWALTNRIQTSGFFSDSVQTLPGDTSRLTTISFSTLGLYSIKLSFNHIVWNGFTLGGIYVSTDNGVTWTMVTGNEYLGSAQSFTFTNSFSSSDYFEWQSPAFCSGLANGAAFKSELFDISGICSNSANVIVKFEGSLDTTFQTPCGSWYIDDLKISGSPLQLSSTDDCNNDGTAGVTPFFGTAPYTYLWSNNATTQTLSNLNSGVYAVTVTDFGGTSHTDSVIIAPPFETFLSVIQPQCPTQLTGQASIFTLGGTPPFSYLWSNGATGQTQVGLTFGTYTVSVTDANGCTASESFNIQCASGIFTSATPSSCSSATGTATVDSVTNATPPYTYQWFTNPAQTTQTATGLNGNSAASVTVTDALGNSYNSFVLVPFADTVFASTNITPSQCNLATGGATAQVSGGVAPYTYLWSTNPPQTTVTASALSAQFYSLTVTDANGCSVLTSVNIPNASNMSATTSSTQTPCGMSTGTASVTVNGGTSPYTYAWNTNPVQTTQTASGLAYGSYNVTITDASGCVLNKSVYVGFVNLINVNISYTNTSCICVDPVATVTGGTAPYTYLWDDGTTNQTASCFDEGWHYVQVTDAAGCTKYKSFNVTYPANCYITLNGTVYDDANKNCILDAGENGIANTPVILSKTGFTETVLTDNNGNYSFYVLNDTFQLFHNPDPSWARNCPSAPPSYNVIVPAGSTTAFDFADTTTAYFIDVAIVNCAISVRTRGFDTDYYITVKNKGNSVASGMVSAVHDAILTYVNSNPIVNTYNFTTKTASWNYVNLNPGATMQFRLTLNIPPTAPLGSVFTNNVDVTPLSTDIDPSNNTCIRSATVNGSYDPNNKINWPSGDIEVTDLWHNYLINFQNTGTAPAVRVIIEDTLDANLDFSTITDFVGSHDFVVDGSQAPIYKFIFDNINLPDSNFNEPESHGFIAFRVMRNTGVPSGTQISNTAHIFFDFNSAIITNTVVNTVIITGINENEYTSAVTVYPNPSTGILYVDFDTNYDKYKVLEIYNAFNQLVSTTEVFDNAGKIKLDLSEYSSGIYSYRLIAKDAVLNSGKISLIR